MEERTYVDCRESAPEGTGCTLRISGRADEVVRAAAQHSVDVHGATAGQGLERLLRGQLKRETGEEWAPEAGPPGGAALH
jgi:hypothetical protein